MLLLERLVEGLEIDVRPFAVCRVGTNVPLPRLPEGPRWVRNRPPPAEFMPARRILLKDIRASKRSSREVDQTV